MLVMVTATAIVPTVAAANAADATRLLDLLANLLGVLSASLQDAWGLRGYAQHLDSRVEDSEWDRKSHLRWCRR